MLPFILLAFGLCIAPTYAGVLPIVPEPLQISNNVLTLKKSAVQQASSSALLKLVADNTTTLQRTPYGAGYAAIVNFQGTDLQLLVDTGSSDTWAVATGFQCVDGNGEQYPEEDCNLGPLYSGSFKNGPIPNTNFRVSYGSGEYVTGEVGLMDISIAGISLTQQEVALVDTAFWIGDNQTSGIVGLAYQALTSSYSGDDPAHDNAKSNLVTYSPVIQTALTRGLFSSFSLALNRNSDDVGGYLALGGIPPVSYSGSFTSTPIRQTNLQSTGRSGTSYSFYTIRPNGFTVTGMRSFFRSAFQATNFDVIVDSGTTLNYMPMPVAARINAMFTPPAVWNPYAGLFEANCSATVPKLSFRINGTDFALNPLDLLLTDPSQRDPDSGLCICTVQPSGGPYILGDAFMRNVVTVFDFGKNQMRFAARS